MTNLERFKELAALFNVAEAAKKFIQAHTDENENWSLDEVEELQKSLKELEESK